MYSSPIQNIQHNILPDSTHNDDPIAHLWYIECISGVPEFVSIFKKQTYFQVYEKASLKKYK